MTLDSENECCAKCRESVSIVKCYGCEQAFCRKYFMKHRLYLSQQMEDLSQKQELLQQVLNRNNIGYPLLSVIYT